MSPNAVAPPLAEAELLTRVPFAGDVLGIEPASRALAALCHEAGATEYPPPRPRGAGCHAGPARLPHDRGSGGWIAWVSPPYCPYAPSLAAWGIDVGRMLVVNGAGTAVRSRLPGVTINVPQGTYLAWLDCSALDLDNPQQFFLEQGKVGLSAGLDFGDQHQQFVRLNFGCPRAMLEEGLHRPQANWVPVCCKRCGFRWNLEDG